MNTDPMSTNGRPAANDATTLAARAALGNPAAADAATHRLRRARTMLLVVEATGLVMLNYMTSDCVDCSPLALQILSAADAWREAEPLLASIDGNDRQAIVDEARGLVDGGFLVVEGSRLASLDERYESHWDWDVRAGLYHFGIKDAEWMSDEGRIADLEERVEQREKVPFYSTNEGCATIVPLERPNLAEGPFALLAKRRTSRHFTGTPAPLAAMRDCLYAGLAILDSIDEPVKGMGRPPLKMTPSGGARNPFEGYLYARNVEGLEPGIYHYSALENSLGLVASAPLPRPSELLGGQDWTNGASAVLFLVANLRRTMWKYSHPNVYRALYIEAGHIGQNVMLAATSHGLTAAPTAALADSTLEDLMSLDRITQGVLYALVIGPPVPGARPGAC
jgi:SagB-type dehydrogenase family enzyme